MSPTLNVLLITTYGTACGIAEHAFYLKEAIEGADPDIQISVETDLHPAAAGRPRLKPDWVWLNYHAALHSQWTPADVRQCRGEGLKVGITYHDTGVPNSEQCKALHAVADCFVIHEPADDLPGAVYLRQGIPDWHAPEGSPYKLRPLVGTVGFPFPWKNYDLLVEAAALAGWDCLLLAPTATPEQVTRWHDLHPHVDVATGFTPRGRVLALLSGCDATAFLYANANTGTSAAIRLGVAARKPVLASSDDACRQFRDLATDSVGQRAIQWLHDLSVNGVADQLSQVFPGAYDPRVVRLAEQDSWAKAGQVYAKLLRERL